MIQLFGKRTVKSRPMPVPGQTTDLGGRMEGAAAAGGGIQAGAHPEYEKGVQFGNPFQQIGNLIGSMTRKKKPKAY